MTDDTAVYVRAGGQTVRVPGTSAVVGRSSECDVRIDSPGVSRRHCEVVLRDDGAAVRDLGSAQGTWIDGRLVTGETRLPRGSPVSLGARGPRFELVAATIHGRSIAGDLEAPSAAAPTLRDVSGLEAPAPESTPAFSREQFLIGLACGLAAGLILGTLALALLALRS